MVDLVTRWFEITQYSNKKAIMIENLIETTWLFRYQCPVEIMYDRGGGSLVMSFKVVLQKNNMGLRQNLIPQVIHRQTQP